MQSISCVLCCALSVGSNSYVTASLGPNLESDPSGSHCSTGRWISLGFSLCLSLRSGLWCWGGGCCFVGRLVRSRTRLSHVTRSSSKGPAWFVLRTRRPLTTRARSRLHPRLRLPASLLPEAGAFRCSYAHSFFGHEPGFHNEKQTP